MKMKRKGDMPMERFGFDDSFDVSHQYRRACVLGEEGNHEVVAYVFRNICDRLRKRLKGGDLMTPRVLMGWAENFDRFVRPECLRWLFEFHRAAANEDWRDFENESPERGPAVLRIKDKRHGSHDPDKGHPSVTYSWSTVVGFEDIDCSRILHAEYLFRCLSGLLDVFIEGSKEAYRRRESHERLLVEQAAAIVFEDE